jgi:hypothetical protein
LIESFPTPPLSREGWGRTPVAELDESKWERSRVWNIVVEHYRAALGDLCSNRHYFSAVPEYSIDAALD